MNKMTRIAAAILILPNIMVLVGQIWPAGAPPFARGANIVILTLNLCFVLSVLLAGKRKPAVT